MHSIHYYLYFLLCNVFLRLSLNEGPNHIITWVLLVRTSDGRLSGCFRTTSYNEKVHDLLDSKNIGNLYVYEQWQQYERLLVMNWLNCNVEHSVIHRQLKEFNR